MTETLTTDPTGRSFVSYRRARLEEAQGLVRAQRELGVPTWQDVEDLDEVQTESEIRRVLNDPATANAVLWLTPEVADSTMIRKVEAPLIVQRDCGGDAFFVVPVAAGGLDYASAAALVNDRLGVHDLGNWNLRRVKSDPAAPDEVRGIARRVLARRFKAVHRTLPDGEPLRFRLTTWQRGASEVGWAALVDWSHRFRGRQTDSGAWEAVLLPALRTLREAART